MKTFRQKVADYSQIIYRVIVFVVAAILLHQILPSEPRFKYEYQLGAPWKHDNLVAPFDFAVLKSSSEIETEKKEITRNFAPYFIRDTMVASRMVSGLLTDLESLIPADYSRREEVTVNLTNAIDKIYSAGILTSSPQSISILTGKSDISQVTGNLVEKIPVSTLFSEKNAYNLFAAEVDGIREKYPGIAHYLSNLDPGKYIRSNLRYDENYTREELQQLEASVSGARGMIQEGEKIILEG